MTKTKAELIEELEAAKATVEALLKEKEKEEVEQLDTIRKESSKAASQFRTCVDAFVDKGFTEDQAITILTSTLKANGGFLR